MCIRDRYLQTQYQINLDGKGKSELATNDPESQWFGVDYKRSPNRGVGLFSLDSGLYFDRNTQLFGKDFRQTLEPRAFYLYVPEEDQTDIPIFDTGEPTFSLSLIHI